MNQSPITSIQHYITQHNLLPTDSTVILGLSGGPDSVFLLHALLELQKTHTFKLIAAHLDHEWRADSENDVNFCRRICKHLGVTLAVDKISNLGISVKFNGSREEVARNFRRHFLESVADKHGAERIALAHHAQDQQETFFIRLLRGASLTGLTSMQPQADRYIRPLLSTNKTDILAWLAEHGHTYLTDPSNASDEFLRNRIRNNVVPALRTADARFDTTFATTLARLQATEAYLKTHTQELFESITICNKAKKALNLNGLLKLDRIMQHRILVHWLCHEGIPFPARQGFLDEMLKFAAQPGSREHQMHHAWSLVKKKNLLTIRR